MKEKPPMAVHVTVKTDGDTAKIIEAFSTVLAPDRGGCGFPVEIPPNTHRVWIWVHGTF